MKGARALGVVLSVGVFIGSACGGGDPKDDQSSGDMKVTRDEMSHEVAVLIDAGNGAFSSGDYETAKQHYLGAASRDSTVAAAWYGVAMAERALGNDAAADSALQRVKGLGDPAAVHHRALGAEDDSTQSPHGTPSPPHSPDAETGSGET